MHSNLNKIMLIGQLGDQVKIHYFEDGNCIARFPLATNESYISKSTQQRVTTTQWHNIVVKNKQAELCEKYLTTGDRIYVEGKVKTTQWTNEQGVQQMIYEVIVKEIKFLRVKQQDNTESTPTFQQINQQNIDNFKVPPIENNDTLPF
ncbi:single-stranded DNA-binding protein [Myroides sp. LJL116]